MVDGGDWWRRQADRPHPGPRAVMILVNAKRNQFPEPVPLSENTPQKLQLELLRSTSFNEFDGAVVAKDLEENPDRWDAFLFTRIARFDALVPLRDLETGFYNVDRIYVKTDWKNLSWFKQKCKEDVGPWRVNEFGYFGWKPGADERHLGEFVAVGPLEEELQDEDSAKRILGYGEKVKCFMRIWWD